MVMFAGRPGKAYYVLVESTTGGMELYQALRGAGQRVRISPAPRGVQACCGVSLLVEPEDIASVCAALAEPGMPPFVDVVELDNQIDPKRDVYC